MVTTDQIKNLRDKTGISVMQCKRALEKAEGDETKALQFLKEESALIAEKKSERALRSGVIGAYIHAGGGMGALVKLCCETDFVSKNPEFKSLAEELAMHIAAMNPAAVADLLDQPFVKTPQISVGELIRGSIQKFGENIIVEEFNRQVV